MSRCCTDYQKLLAEQPVHNAQLDSYLSRAGIGRLHRQLHSLNLPRETAVEVQNKMIASLGREFTDDDKAKVA